MARLAIIESPFAGNIEANLEYARKACKECLDRGETPFASHLFFPQFLDDDLDTDRSWGISAGFDIARAFQKAAMTQHDDCANFEVIVYFYIDNGWSKGMYDALTFHSERGIRCEVRRLGQSLI